MNIHCMPLGALEANCYIVSDEATEEAFVIDPGDEADKIINYIDSAGLKPTYIILTHAHADHIGALDELKRRYDAKIVVSRSDEAPLNNDVWNLCSQFGFPSPKSTANIPVSDGDTLPFAGTDLYFIHTPGHTKGSMCILCDTYLFSGDTLFRQSIGRTDFIGGSFEDIINSIKNKILTLNEQITVFPGHGEATSILYEKENNPFV